MHSRNIAGLDYGHIVVGFGGSMFAGKSEFLINKIKSIGIEETVRANKAKREGQSLTLRPIGAFKHSIDDRYANGSIATHSHMTYPAVPTNCVASIEEEVLLHDYRIVVIDEIQFFNEKDEAGNWKIELLLLKFAAQKRLVIVAGLCKDFKGEAFGPMGNIIAISDDPVPLKGICAICGSPSTMPQRLVNNEPAYNDDPIVLVGAEEDYEPRCRNCHEIWYRSKGSDLAKRPTSSTIENTMKSSI